MAHTYGPSCHLTRNVSFTGTNDDMPVIKAQFFYSSPLPIDDPLSAVPATSGSDVQSTKHPLRPFSAYDNNLLEEAWLGLASKKDRKSHYKGKPPKTESRSKNAKDKPQNKPYTVASSSRIATYSEIKGFMEPSSSTSAVFNRKDRCPEALKEERLASNSRSESDKSKPLDEQASTKDIKQKSVSKIKKSSKGKTRRQSSLGQGDSTDDTPLINSQFFQPHQSSACTISEEEIAAASIVKKHETQQHTGSDCSLFNSEAREGPVHTPLSQHRRSDCQLVDAEAGTNETRAIHQHRRSSCDLDKSEGEFCRQNKIIQEHVQTSCQLDGAGQESGTCGYFHATNGL